MEVIDSDKDSSLLRYGKVLKYRPQLLSRLKSSQCDIFFLAEMVTTADKLLTKNFLQKWGGLPIKFNTHLLCLFLKGVTLSDAMVS